MTRLLRHPATRRATAVAAIALVHGAAAGALAAQAVDVQAAASVSFESFSFDQAQTVDLDRVSLLAVPVTVRAGLTPQLELSLAAAYARGLLVRGDGSESTIAGPTDTELRATWISPRDRIRISGIALLPTGRTELTAAEMDVTGVVAADLLPFRLTNWGTGGGFGLSAAAAIPVADGTAVGLSAGYVVAREYEPLDATSFAYRPGNQLLVRAAVDRTFGSASKASLQLTYQQFGTDEAAGTNLYQAGDRLQAMGSYAFAAGQRSSGIAYAGYLRRQGGRYPAAARVTPAQDIIYGGLGMRVPAGSLVLTPALDARIVGNADGVDQGYILGAGAGAEIRTTAVMVVPSARVRYGQLTVIGDAESGFTGFELGVTVRRQP
jgi:hypothetical protein